MSLRPEDMRRALRRAILRTRALDAGFAAVGAASGAFAAPLAGAPEWAAALLGGGLGGGLRMATGGRRWPDIAARRIEARRRREGDRDVRALLERIIARAPAPTLLIDRAGRILFASAAAETLLGRPVRRRHISDAIRAPGLLDAVDEALRHDRDDDFDVTLHRSRPRLLSASVRALPEQPDAPGAPRALVMLQDLSALRRAQETRMDFVANASHELRTPLSAIGGFIETLRGPARDDPQARERFLEIMATETARMTRLVNDLLSLSRIELDENVAPTEPQDLRAAIDAALATVAQLAREREQEIRVALPDGSLSVPGVADELAQVFINLLENAIRYGASPHPIEIGLAEPAHPGDDRIAVFVRDRGRGVHPRHLPRLTERFYRVDAGASRASGGTGLGLAIVKHIVNRHRGALEIQSAPGEGACFTVRLPRAGQPEQPSGKPKKSL